MIERLKIVLLFKLTKSHALSHLFWMCCIERQYNVIWGCVVSGLANDNERERERKWSVCVYLDEISNRYSSDLHGLLRTSVSFFWAIRSCAAFSFSSTHTLILKVFHSNRIIYVSSCICEPLYLFFCKKRKKSKLHLIQSSRNDAVQDN